MGNFNLGRLRGHSRRCNSRNNQQLASSMKPTVVRRCRRIKPAKRRQLNVALAELRATLVSSGRVSPLSLRSEDQVILATINRIRDLERTLVESIAGENASEEEKAGILQSVRESFASSSSSSVPMDFNSPTSVVPIPPSTSPKLAPSEGRRRLDFGDDCKLDVDKEQDAGLAAMEDFLSENPRSVSGSKSIFDGFEDVYAKLRQPSETSNGT